jgi:phage tail sheath gpL-like
MGSPNISFESIPSSIRKPGVYAEFNTKLAAGTLPSNLQRVLLIGQRLAAGTVAELVPTPVFSDAEAATYFGRGSMAHLMAKAAIKANPYLDLTVCALDDSDTGVAASGTVTIAGPATGSGSLVVYVGAQRIEIGIASAATATEIGAALVAELDKYPDLPATGSNNAGVVTFTARNKGTLGNAIALSASVAAAGVTAVVVAMASGAVDPVLASALAPIAPSQFHVIVSPYNDATSYAALKAHLETVSGAIEQRSGIAVMAFTAALASATTLGGTLNYPRITLPFLRYTAASKAQSLPCELAAGCAAVIAGEEDPAKPLNTLEIRGIAVPAIADRLTRTEQESCLYNGVTPLEVGPGERVQFVRVISTYVENAAGVPDIALLDLTTIRTLDYVRKACRERLSLRFPREKLFAKTPTLVRTELLDVLLKLEELEIVEAVMDHIDGLIVERDSQDPNRINWKIPTDVVNGMHISAGRLDLLL